jgi:hypothetical protein
MNRPPTSCRGGCAVVSWRCGLPVGLVAGEERRGRQGGVVPGRCRPPVGWTVGEKRQGRGDRAGGRAAVPRRRWRGPSRAASRPGGVAGGEVVTRVGDTAVHDHRLGTKMLENQALLFPNGDHGLGFANAHAPISENRRPADLSRGSADPNRRPADQSRRPRPLPQPSLKPPTPTTATRQCHPAIPASPAPPPHPHEVAP